jgi:anti-sigma factor RsiW
VLTAYLDGELKPSTAQAVRRHLEHCQSCSEHAKQLEQAWETLDTLHAPPVRPGFTERMMARIVEEKDLEALEERLRPDRRLRQIVAAVSGLAAGLVLGLAAYTWTGLTAEPASPVEREVCRNVAFLEDADLVDEMAVIEAMDRLSGKSIAEDGV